MSIPRSLLLNGITVLSTAVVCFVAVDRVTHLSFPAPPTIDLARTMVVDEPDTTGTVTQGAEVPETRPVRGLDGFDTERLNALMRGELPPAPLPGRTAARTAAASVAKTVARHR